MFPKGFEIPAEKEEIAPGIGYPVGIGICIQRITRPTSIGKAIPHIIAQFCVSRQQVQATFSFTSGRQVLWRTPATSKGTRCLDADSVRPFIAVL